MSLNHRMSTPIRVSSRRSSCGKKPAASANFTPMVETLEGRTLFSTLTVLNNQDGAAGSLRAQITAAHGGDTIVFAPSLAGQSITLTNGELLIKKNLTITGPGAGLLTISGNHLSRVFEVAKGYQVAMSGLTISNGYVVSALAKSGYSTTDGDGAGIFNQGLLAISGCTISHNAAVSGGGGDYNGGGIDNYGTLAVSGATLSYNTAGGGGGIYNERGGTLTVNGNSILSYNTAVSQGGGIGSEGTATINGSQLLNNSAFSGGGIANYAIMTVSGCILSGNIANSAGNPYPGSGGDGGGICALSTAHTTSMLTVDGCILTGNSATEHGGGIWAGSGTVKVLNGTALSGNSASYGGAIYNYNGAVTVSSTALTSNSAASEGGAIYNSIGMLSVGGSSFSLNTPDSIFGTYNDTGGNTFT